MNIISSGVSLHNFEYFFVVLIFLIISSSFKFNVISFAERRDLHPNSSRPAGCYAKISVILLTRDERRQTN